jgi:Flp pilus assembly protein TadD
VRSGERAVNLAPRSQEAHLALAEAYISARRNIRAVEHLRKVGGLFPGSPHYHYTLGIAQFRASQFRPAIESLRRAVELNPKMDLAQFLLGSALLQTGELEEAELSLQAAIRLNPRQPLFHNRLARLYEEKGPESRGAALAATMRVLELDPRDADSRHRLAGWALADGNLPRARELLEGIVRDAPAFTPARVLLATVYHRLRLKKQAAEQEEVIRRMEAEEQKRQQPPEDY